MATPRSESYSAASGASVFAGRASVPTWLLGAAVNQWLQIAGTTHMGSAADPSDTGGATSRSTKRLSYSNIATDLGARVILAATGGHGDYTGNEVTGIDLSANAPAWSLLNARSASVQSSVAYYSDGKPSSRHGYWGAQYSSTKAGLMLHFTRATSPSAVSFNATNRFDLANNTWDAAGANANAAGPAICRDSSDNAWAYVNSGTQLWKWTPATDTWTQTGSFANPVYPPMAHDSSRGQFFALAWGDGQASGSGVSAYRYNGAGTTQTAITLNSIGGALAQFQSDAGSYASMVYDPFADAYFWWDGTSGRLYKIVPNSGTTWDISIVSTTGTPPPSQSYSFGRMAHIPSLKGLVFMPSGHQNLYFMRTA
jgi:hypothetical protein